MKISKRFSFIVLIIALIPCQAMEAETEDGMPQFQITAKTLAQHEARFKRFVKKVEREDWPKLQRLPENTDTWTGWAITGAINTLIIPFTKKPQLRPKESRIFLGRVFSTPTTEPEYKVPEILEQGIKKLKEDDSSEYFAYISGVLNRISRDDLENGSIKHLPDEMELEKKRYPHMPGTRNMSNRTEVPDETFAPFAVAQLFATCCVEEKLLLEEKDRVSKHPHSKSRKRLSIEA